MITTTGVSSVASDESLMFEMTDIKEQTQQDMIFYPERGRTKIAVGTTYVINKHESQNPGVGSITG